MFQTLARMVTQMSEPVSNDGSYSFTGISEEMDGPA